MNRPHKKQKLSERGSVLIMSLIILSGFMIVATEFALLIISGIRQARSIDNSTRAYYAAEGGAESALYQVRKENVSGSTLIRPSRAATATGGGSWDLTNDPNGGIFTDSTDSIDRALLEKNDSIEIALHTSNGQLATTAQSLKVEWRESNCTNPAHPTPWIETSVVEWNGASAIDWGGVQVRRFFKDGPTNEVVTNALTPAPATPPLPSPAPTMVRVKTYYCDVRGLKITAYNAPDAGGTQLPIPNYYLIKPVARAGDATASLQVIMPKKTQTSSVYDYVLFSEAEIVKQ